MSLFSQTVHAPLALRALLYSRQFVVLYCLLTGLLDFFAITSRAHQSAVHRFVQQSPTAPCFWPAPDTIQRIYYRRQPINKARIPPAMSDVCPIQSSINSAPYTVDIVSPQFPCGSSWLANALLEMQVLLRHLWSFETAGEWEHGSNGVSRYIAQHLPWGQTLPSLRVGKTFQFHRDIHPRFSHLYPWQLEPCSKIVLMVRDPRDALYSIWQWQQHNEKYPPSIPFTEYLASPFYGGPISIVDMLWLHLRSWLSLRTDESRQVYVLRFEDWKRDPVGELTAVTRWMGLDCGQSVLARAAAASDVSNLHRIEGELARANPNARRFHRLGQPEEWRIAWQTDWSKALGRHWLPVYRALGYPPPSRFGPVVPAFDLNRVLAWRDLTEPALVQQWHHKLSTYMIDD